MKFLKNKSRLNILAHLLNVSALVGVCLLFVACNESGGETIAQPSNVDSWSEESGTGTIFSSAIQNASSSSIVLPPITYGSMTDSRDDQIYKTVTIGTQIWMAENLKYVGPISYCYDDEIENCKVYGNLYPWNSAIEACPSGWRLPSEEDFEVLFATIDSALGTTHYFYESFLKSTYGWGECSENPNGLDLFGFSALPAGKRLANGSFDDIYCGAFFWTATERRPGIFDEERACNYNIVIYDGGDGWGDGLKENAYSVRCLKEDEKELSSSSVKMEISSSSGGIFTDVRDGQTYKTVKIGTQTWMAENLNYMTKSSFCYNDSAEYCEKYGRLYMWTAAIDKSESECGRERNCSLPSGNVQGVCPKGWHLPSKAEWELLLTAVGGYGEALMSSSGWTDTKGKSCNGTDDFAFSALPAGCKDGDYGYYFENHFAFFWSSTEVGSDNAYVFEFCDSHDVGFEGIIKTNGFSVRCVKD